MNEKILTRKEASKILHVSVSTLRNWNKTGKLIASRIGNKIYYPESRIKKALEVR